MLWYPIASLSKLIEVFFPKNELSFPKTEKPLRRSVLVRICNQKQMRKLLSLLLMMVCLSCNWLALPEEENQSVASSESNNIEDLIIPEGFEFATFHQNRVKISAVDNKGNLLHNIPFQIFKGDASTRHLLLSGSTGADGIFEVDLEVENIVEQLVLTTGYPGLADKYTFPAQQESTDILLGDPTSLYVAQGVKQEEDAQVARLALQNKTQLRSVNFDYMGGYNTQGVPNYLEPTDDVVDQRILDLIANSLPEGQPVPNYNPQYIAAAVNSNIALQDSADVWVTFIHEGAGYRNALGYYTYSTGNPPDSPEDINNFKIIFPNVSYSGSGGGLRTGNKVRLGSFSAGTSIAWFLIPNGWNANDRLVEVEDDKPVKYSTGNFNTFTEPAYQNHTVLLKSEAEQLLLLGFEDIGRPGGDNDFNDAIFMVSANPFSAVVTDGIVEAQVASSDEDGDGVADPNDAFLNDPEIAFVNHNPAQGQFASLAFEDQWPNKGDYDMNDMVLDYNFIEYRDAQNKAIKLRGVFILKAMGAGFQNGFGFELAVPPSLIKEVTGSRINDDFIELASNGLETGQERSVVIVFDNGHRLMRNPEGGFVNTELFRPQVTPDTITIDIDLQSPTLSSDLGVAPFNPFIIKNRQRGVEIHLINGRPTSKANTRLFGTVQDASEPNLGKYYQTASGLPWAIQLARPFSWPVEKAPVNQAYLMFGIWAETGGFEYPDWYLENAGYRDTQKIY